MKIHPVGAELFHPDERTDRQDKAFRNFANAPRTVKSVAHNWLQITSKWKRSNSYKQSQVVTFTSFN
jgi:hypothetical protein